MINRKTKVVEEDKKIRINLINKICEVHNGDDVEEVLKIIVPLLRNKKRSIFLMGGNYEEVNVETKNAIVSYMISVPKVAKENT